MSNILHSSFEARSWKQHGKQNIPLLSDNSKFTQIYPNYPKWSDFQWLISREIEFFGENHRLFLVENWLDQKCSKHGCEISVEFWEIVIFPKNHSKITPFWSEFHKKCISREVRRCIPKVSSHRRPERMLGSCLARGFCPNALLVVSVGCETAQAKFTPKWSDFCGKWDKSSQKVFYQNRRSRSC